MFVCLSVYHVCLSESLPCLFVLVFTMFVCLSVYHVCLS